jgi:hypothetical protein
MYLRFMKRVDELKLINFQTQKNKFELDDKLIEYLGSLVNAGKNLI